MYSRQLNRRDPGCVILMLDQSGSMEEPFYGTPEPKKDVLARAVNGFIVELVLRCVKGPNEAPRDYFDIGLIGYGEQLGWLLGTDGPIPVSEMADRGNTLDRSANGFPMWVEPTAGNGTPYCGALDAVGRVLHGWIKGHPGSFPPMVINLTDGAPTDGDPSVWSDRVRSLGTDDGTVLLFNINLSALPGTPMLFPSDMTQMGDDFARALFQQSSVLPEPMVAQAQALGLHVAPGARGFGFNVDFTSINQFLRVGTSVGLNR